MTSFDWSNLGLPEGTPLHDCCAEPVHTVRRLFRCAEAVYAVTNVLVFGGTEENPGVGGFLWAESEPTAVRVYENLAVDRRPSRAAAEPFPPAPFPPADVLGLADLTYRTIGDREAAHGEVDVRVGSTIPDGAFTTTRLSCAGRTYYFAEIEPADDDRPIAIRFDLPRVVAA